MTKDQLVVENQWLRRQLLGTRLLAGEMDDHLETVRHFLAKLKTDKNIPGDLANAVNELQRLNNILKGE